jgi:hypothetical protein
MPRERSVTSVKHLGREANRHRVHRAFLAEDYDGIGQYVKVTLSRNAVTSGLRARLCSGDFGTGQIIPQGTPVAVFSAHGQLEVLSLGAK